MNTTSIGKEAESRTAEYLKKLGFMIIAINWRSRSCEIDIVANKNNKIYFIEVKYRHSDKSGDGFDAINATKLKQMN